MPENEEFYVEKSEQPVQEQNGQKVIDEANYKIHAPQSSGPAAVGQGGDPLFRNIRATKEQLVELLDETTSVQDWIQKETCNNVALNCLDNENLKEAYYEIKNGFGEYGPIILMGFKTPQGVEIPRLKCMGKDGSVEMVLTGPMAIAEIAKRAEIFRTSINDISEVIVTDEECEVIQDYSGNPDDYAS